ncbi:Tetratricopeptide repeat (TPR)-like superfamily protein [Striga hermonthica]|uniref:Tetratricopeptide repeat (TPR)-like superfamily protein n=1 Tax=Striga hermonthica TaxID=68872 RepID=A0A9N7NQT2_STRHE|nr:Tetratricopeptide repeat (TPR)-like superfamily protein [Striga hermonthica]
MEKLKSVIPEELRRRISESKTDDLRSTCFSLLNFFETSHLFHQMVRDLTSPEMALCGKSKEGAMEAKAKGNECFSKGDYSSALHFYSQQALRVAPKDVKDKEKNLVATLFLNRASSLHKLGLFLESLRDCSRALIISPAYAKAWFWRAKANSSLGNLKDAIDDLNVSLSVETSSSGKRQIESELNMLMGQSRLRSKAVENPNNDNSDERLQMDLHCVSTTAKGRGMAASTDIPLASLIHKEEPYAAILLKHCRETHCAFCFNELPADTVPCVSCSIPLYCSLKCQVQAGDQYFSNCKKDHGSLQDLPHDLVRYIRNVTLPDISSSNTERAPEHRHECRGMHWSAVLPSDVVLAGRILVKHMEEQGSGAAHPIFHGVLNLCQNYERLSAETKLEYHIYSIILRHSLQQFYSSKLSSELAIAPEIILLLSKIRVNSMAIVRIKCSDGQQHPDCDATSSVEQVQVAQAVYCGGSLFNHSCQPNVHGYFLSRTLFIRATENVAAGSDLELSYGPQVGEWDCSERRKFLEDRYSFICQCNGCAQVNLPDLFHSGYRCTKPKCFGVVLDIGVAEYELEKFKYCKGLNSLQECVLNDNKFGGVARHMFEQSDYWRCFKPGHCLSCGSFCDIQASQRKITGGDVYVRRLQDTVASGDQITTNLITDALKYIDILKAVLHPFNKRVAEVEDNIAQAFCLVGELRAALDHCQASIEILEMLYGENHIVVGNELIKLASIRHSMGDKMDEKDTSRMVQIFSRYYGSHTDIIFPHLRYLKSGARSSV